MRTGGKGGDSKIVNFFFRVDRGHGDKFGWKKKKEREKKEESQIAAAQMPSGLEFIRGSSSKARKSKLKEVACKLYRVIDQNILSNFKKKPKELQKFPLILLDLDDTQTGYLIKKHTLLKKLVK